MAFIAPWRRRAPPPNSAPNNIRDLPPTGSRGVRAALSIAAVGLVISSAGFGATYAWTATAGHGPVLAGLAVLMAVALETCKPFAIEATFGCLRRWAIGRALAMALLAVVAIGYSLTAELSLMATARGDATADREAVADARQMAKDRHRRAGAELAALPPSRPVGELQALIGGKDCDDTASKVTRTLCAELGRATRRAELDAVLSKAESDTTGRKAVGAGDAGAAALSTLLMQLGWTVPAGALSTWLTLVGVLALEVGSSLAVVLVRSAGVDGPRRRPVAPAVDSPAPTPPAPVAPVHAPAEPRETAKAPRRGGQSPRTRPTGSKDAAATQIVDKLREQGGRAPGGSVRRLGQMIGERKSTTWNALGMLVASGVIERVGSELVLRS